MQVEISPETSDRLNRLIQRGIYDSAEAAIDDAVAQLSETDEIYEAELDERLNAARASALAGRHQLLTLDLVEQIKREGRQRLADQSSRR